MSENEQMPFAVGELRLVVTADDFDRALSFYRDVRGLRERAAFVSEGGRVVILDAGHAALELTDPAHAAFIDEVEVGRRTADTSSLPFVSTTAQPRLVPQARQERPFSPNRAGRHGIR